MVALENYFNFLFTNLSPKNFLRISEKLDTFEGTYEQQLSEVVEKLTNRVKKLENDFQRYETNFGFH